MTEGDLANSTDVPEISDVDVHYLASLYGIKSYMISFIKPLPSYDDRVFHIGVYKQFINKPKGIAPIVLKCSIINSFDRMDMQIKFMKRLYDNNVPSPKPILLLPKNIQTRTNNHKYIYVTCNNPLQNENKSNVKYKVNVHCMSYIENSIVANSIDQTDSLFLNNLGQTVGNLSLALKGFEHKAGHFEFIWDLQYAMQALPLLEYVKDQTQFKLLQIYIDNYKNILLPAIRNNKLRQSIIHGDLNDMNMLCNSNGYPKQIMAFLDFGDCKWSCTVFDVAICCAYFMLNKNKQTALKVMHGIINGYNKIFPLTDEEINVLFVAICSRMLTSVLVANEKTAKNPENREYYAVHSRPGWTLLQHFADTNPLEIAKEIKQKLYSSKL